MANPKAIAFLYEDYIFHMFSLHLQVYPKVILSNDIDYVWASHSEAIHMPLMDGGQEVLKFFQMQKLRLIN